MCKFVDYAIRRGTVLAITYNPVGGRISVPEHFFKGVIVAKKSLEGGMVVIIQNDPPWYSEYNRYTRLWYQYRGPCGIVHGDKEIEEVVKQYHEAFEAQAMNAMAL